MNVRKGLAASFVCVALAGNLPAQELAQKRALEQKLEFVRTLIGDSPAVQRISASGNDVARKHLDEGRAHYTNAVELMKAGDLQAAEKAANDAIWSIGRARQLVQDTSNKMVAEKLRNQQLLASTERLIPTYKTHLAQSGLDADADLAAAQGLIEQANAFVQAERLGDANRTLLEAERHLLLGLTRLVGSRTLDYTPRFDSAAKEYEYELERNRSFGELVPLAMGELNPGADARNLIARFVERSQALRSQALAQAGQKQYASAVTLLKDATLQLQRALAAAGLTVPQQ
jgi:hypothetical protein